MTKQFIRNLSVALLAAACTCAQGSQTLTVQVPFGFHVGNSMLPEGAYTVDTQPGPGVVRLRSADSKTSVMILSNAVQTSATRGAGKLVFHKYGDEYFLNQIWGAEENTGRELRVSRREIEVSAIARRGVQSVMASK